MSLQMRGGPCAFHAASAGLFASCRCCATSAPTIFMLLCDALRGNWRLRMQGTATLLHSLIGCVLSTAQLDGGRAGGLPKCPPSSLSASRYYLGSSPSSIVRSVLALKTGLVLANATLSGH